MGFKVYGVRLEASGFARLLSRSGAGRAPHSHSPRAAVSADDSDSGALAPPFPPPQLWQ